MAIRFEGTEVALAGSISTLKPKVCGSLRKSAAAVAPEADTFQRANRDVGSASVTVCQPCVREVVAVAEVAVV